MKFLNQNNNGRTYFIGKNSVSFASGSSDRCIFCYNSIRVDGTYVQISACSLS